MAITIDGSSAAGTINLGSNGTISNLAVGGLPDGTVDGDTLASGAGGAALTGSTNNTVCTVTGSGAFQGEANLTFDGSKLCLGGGSDRTAGGNANTAIFETLTNNAGLFLVTDANAVDSGSLRIGHSRATSIGGNTAVNAEDTLGNVEFHGNEGSQFRCGARIQAKCAASTAGNSVPGRLRFMVTADAAANPTERFRIAMNGDLTATDTSIGSLSDQRLKKNIADFTYDLSKFKAFKPRTFEWKNPAYHSTATGIRGFVAQELESTDNYWVTEQVIDEDENGSNPDLALVDSDKKAKVGKLGQKDAMYVSVIQQLITKIETLETKVAALEGG